MRYLATLFIFGSLLGLTNPGFLLVNTPTLRPSEHCRSQEWSTVVTMRSKSRW